MNKLEARREIVRESGFAPLQNGSHCATKRALEALTRGRPSKCVLRSIRGREKKGSSVGQGVFSSAASNEIDPLLMNSILNQD